MRLPFTDTTRLKYLAKARAEQDLDYLERFYERRYNQPAFSGKFEDRSAAAWQLELLTEAWRRRMELQTSIKAQQEMGADNKQVKARMRTAYQHLRAIDNLFGDAVGPQDLTHQWDEQLKAGKAPDLAKHVAGLKISDGLKKALERLSKPKAG